MSEHDNTQPERSVDKLLEDLEAEKAARSREEERLGEVLKVDEHTAAKISEERKNKVSGFKLDIDLDEEFQKTEEPAPPSVNDTEEPAPSGEPAEETAESLDEDEPTAEPEGPEEETDGVEPEEEPEEAGRGKKKKKTKKSTWGCVRGIIYAVLVLGISGVLAYFTITGAIDLAGLGKSSGKVDVVIPRGASTQQVADALKEGGVIDQPLVFRLYSKLTKADGTYQPGTFTLAPNMGYGEMIRILQNSKPRESVSVTIKEGFTINQIAEELEKAGVCDADDFFEAVVYGKYEDAYDFVAAIPGIEQGSQYEGRIYKLEGYMFPDTYEFFTGSSGDTVVRKFLDNFAARLDTKLRSAISAQGKTIDEIIVMASIIQGEASKEDDMLKVSRVLYNRLNNPSEYPRLECDSTQKYFNDFISQIEGLEITNKAYDTYKRTGLPAGAINNPGLMAIQAAINPSQDEEVAGCYFFATDFNTGITYYSKTLKEHERICRKYGIGMYG